LTKKNILFLIAFIAVVWLLAPAFQTIDDVIMLQIVSGKYGHSTSDLMLYSSPFWGKILVFMYEKFPGVHWYYLGFLLAHAVSWRIILHALFANKGQHKQTTWLLFAFLFTGFGMYFLGNMQFTTTAFLLGLAGILLLVKHQSAPALLASALLLFIASLIRFYSILLLVWLTLPWMFYHCVLKEGFLKILHYKKGIAIMALVGLSMVTAREMGKAEYRKTEPGKVFREFIFERGRLIDNPNFVYTPQNAHVYAEAGWTETNHKIFSGFYFDHTSPYDHENLNYLYNNLPVIKPDAERIFAGLSSMAGQYQLYALLLLLAITALLRLRVTRKGLFFLVLQTGTILVFLLYVLLYNEFKPRVVIPLFFVGSLGASLFLTKGLTSSGLQTKQGFKLYQYAMVLFVVLAVFINTLQALERRNNHKELQVQIALINRIEKDWLLINGYAFPLEHQRLGLLNRGSDLNGNVYFTMPATFMHYKTGHKYDAKHQSVFDLLTQKEEKLVLINSSEQLTVDELNQYLQTRSKKSVKYVPVKMTGMKYPVFVKSPVNNQ
jgi:hypothetical protein